MSEDLSTIFSESATKANNASDIAYSWANGDVNTSITTATDILPSLAKFMNDNISDGLLEIDMTSGDRTLTLDEFNSYRYFNITTNPSPTTLTIAPFARYFFVENQGLSSVTIKHGTAEYVMSSGDITMFYTDGSANSLEDILASIAAGLGITQTNLTATTDPTVTDDNTQGYSVGSVWVNNNSTPKEAFICLDATTSNAVWANTTLTIDEMGALATADNALEVPYDNSGAGLTASNVKDALDELSTESATKASYSEAEDLAVNNAIVFAIVLG